MSTKTAVTGRRSSSRTGGGASAAATGAPQLMQNLATAGFSAPHWVQTAIGSVYAGFGRSFRAGNARGALTQPAERADREITPVSSDPTAARADGASGRPVRRPAAGLMARVRGLGPGSRGASARPRRTGCGTRR